MGMFSRAVDKHGTVWQFRTGFDDDFGLYNIGDAVPYHRNEQKALDVRWEDDVLDAVSENGSRHAWVVIKDHKLDAVVPSEQLGQIFNHGPIHLEREALLSLKEIRQPQLSDWSDEAQLAYHEAEADRIRKWIAYRDQIGRECGDMEWYKKPGAHTRLTLREEGLLRRLLPPTEVSS